MLLCKITLKLYLAHQKISLMKIRKFTFYLVAMLIIISSCKDDDDSSNVTPPRDRQEVYDEDIIEIEEYLSTHFYNYDEFDFDDPYNVTNDTFQIVFDTIAGDNSDKIPLIDRPELKFKMVTDNEDIEYKLYYLEVRKGGGNVVHFTDRVYASYEGFTIPENTVFDSRVDEIPLSLVSSDLETGIIQGLADVMVEFKTSNSYTENGDGTTQYHGHGIGTAFIPSGLGYFNTYIPSIGDTYVPLVFKFNLVERVVTDHDSDNIFSYMEDIDGNGNIYDDDTDGDNIPDFLDVDDDGDLVLTKDEIDYATYIVDTNMGETEPVLAENEFEESRTEEAGVITINTVILTDTNNDGLPDYLDPDTAIED